MAYFIKKIEQSSYKAIKTKNWNNIITKLHILNKSIIELATIYL